jgi:hypothetical protein
MPCNQLQEPKNLNVITGLEKQFEFIAVDAEVVGEVIPDFVQTDDVAIQQDVTPQLVDIKSHEAVAVGSFLDTTQDYIPENGPRQWRYLL